MWQIIGQEKAVSFLKRSLETSSVANAYLFTGPEHSGKMTLALNLAQALNCTAAEKPCGLCDACRRILAGNHSDVQVIDMNPNSSEVARTRITVEQMQEMQRFATLPPFEGGWKVFIINGAELFSPEAANRILKTLEEPNERVVFVLLAVNNSLTLPTVVSRCQRIDLIPVAAEVIENALVERYGTERGKASLLAKLSHCLPGWAVSAALNGAILQQRSMALDRLAAVVGGDAEERFSYASQLAEQFSKNREQVYDKLSLLLDWWRDVILIKVGLTESAVNIDRLDTLAEMAEWFSLQQMRRFVQSVRTVIIQLRLNAGAKLALDMMVMSMPEAPKPAVMKSPVL